MFIPISLRQSTTMKDFWLERKLLNISAARVCCAVAHQQDQNGLMINQKSSNFYGTFLMIQNCYRMKQQPQQAITYTAQINFNKCSFYFKLDCSCYLVIKDDNDRLISRHNLIHLISSPLFFIFYFDLRSDALF